MRREILIARLNRQCFNASVYIFSSSSLPSAGPANLRSCAFGRFVVAQRFAPRWHGLSRGQAGGVALGGARAAAPPLSAVPRSLRRRAAEAAAARRGAARLRGAEGPATRRSSCFSRRSPFPPACHRLGHQRLVRALRSAQHAAPTHAPAHRLYSTTHCLHVLIGQVLCPVLRASACWAAASWAACWPSRRCGARVLGVSWRTEMRVSWLRRRWTCE